MNNEPVKKRKRNRPHLSCLACAKAKRMCSKELPCTNCSLRNLECIYENGAHSSPRAKDHVPQGQQPQPGVSVPSVASTSSKDMTSNGADPSSVCDARVTGPAVVNGPGNVSLSPTTSFSPASTEDCSYTAKKPTDFVIQSETSYQRKKIRYYGPSSGPSLLLWHLQVPATQEFRSPFPVEAILDLDKLLQCYYESLHWVISLFEWRELKEWLRTDNIADINATIYMVLALACVVLGRDGDAAAFYNSSNMACPDDVFHCGYSEARLVLQLLRVYYLEMMGKSEQLWVRLGILINSATAMGYHRQMPQCNQQTLEEYIIETKKRSRLWYSIIVAERKCALFLGRPYSVRTDFYDVEFSKIEEYNYETSFRDNINRMAPFYTAIIDETLSPDPDFDKLVKIDQQLSGWLFDSAPTGCPQSAADVDGGQGFETKMMATQEYYRMCYQYFLRSRIYRIFLEHPDIAKRSFAFEQFFNANKVFCTVVMELRNRQWTVGLHDLVGFTVDNALFYSTKVYGIPMRKYKQCALETLDMFKVLLKSVSERKLYCAKLAKAALQVVNMMEKHAGIWDEAAKKKLSSSLRYPFQEHTGVPLIGSNGGMPGGIPGSTPGAMPNGTVPQFVPDGSVNILDSAPVSFGLPDWDTWLKELLGNSQTEIVYE